MKVSATAKSLVHLLKYKMRDVTGDNIPETFCNYFVADVAYLVGCTDFSPAPDGHPFPKLANEIVTHMELCGERWQELDPDEAQSEANFGNLVIAGWKNKAGHGHVNIIVQGTLKWSKQFSDDVPNSANVGTSNYYGRPVSYGFRSDMRPRYWVWIKPREEKS